MSDQEAWHELCNLYMADGEFAKAAFCMEELLLHNPHSHLYHQRLAEIRYTMVNHSKSFGLFVCLKKILTIEIIDIFSFLLGLGWSREY